MVGTLPRMKRRGLTVLLGALMTALLAVGVLTVPMPYVVLNPGPTVNTLGQNEGRDVIHIEKAAVSQSAGQLRLTTVGVQPNVELVWAIRGWFSDDQAVVPRELIYPPDETEEQVEQRNAEDFKASQTSAETVALRELGYPVQVSVAEVVAGGAAAGALRAGDVITSVDGTAVTSATKLTDLVRAKPAGTTLAVGYSRAGTPATAQITSKSDPAGEPPRIGVKVKADQPHPFTLKIELEKIGGPSAGLMFTLGIIDKLRPEDLTGGKIIAGTGTIDDEGAVGPIGGIAQKLRGAKDAGATVFLVPADNCAEAVRNRVDGLTMARVGTVKDALAALETLKSGGIPSPCP
jgi:PDZ domain-containing protein